MISWLEIVKRPGSFGSQQNPYVIMVRDPPIACSPLRTDNFSYGNNFAMYSGVMETNQGHYKPQGKPMNMTQFSLMCHEPYVTWRDINTQITVQDTAEKMSPSYRLKLQFHS